MTIKNLFVCLTFTAAIAGCKKGGGGADIDAFMKLDTEKAAAFAVGGEDCEAKAKSVGDWRKANTANYKAMQKKLNDQWSKGPPEDVVKKYGEQMKKNKMAVMDAMMACSNNEAFGKMMDETKTE